MQVVALEWRSGSRVLAHHAGRRARLLHLGPPSKVIFWRPRRDKFGLFGVLQLRQAAVVGDFADRILVLMRNNPWLHVDNLPTGRLISILQSVGGNCCHCISGA